MSLPRIHAEGGKLQKNSQNKTAEPKNHMKSLASHKPIRKSVETKEFYEK